MPCPLFALIPLVVIFIPVHPTLLIWTLMYVVCMYVCTHLDLYTLDISQFCYFDNYRYQCGTKSIYWQPNVHKWLAFAGIISAHVCAHYYTWRCGVMNATFVETLPLFFKIHMSLPFCLAGLIALVWSTPIMFLTCINEGTTKVTPQTYACVSSGLLSTQVGPTTSTIGTSLEKWSSR